MAGSCPAPCRPRERGPSTALHRCLGGTGACSETTTHLGLRGKDTDAGGVEVHTHLGGIELHECTPRIDSQDSNWASLGAQTVHLAAAGPTARARVSGGESPARALCGFVLHLRILGTFAVIVFSEKKKKKPQQTFSK